MRCCDLSKPKHKRCLATPFRKHSLPTQVPSRVTLGTCNTAPRIAAVMCTVRSAPKRSTFAEKHRDTLVHKQEEDELACQPEWTVHKCRVVPATRLLQVQLEVASSALTRTQAWTGLDLSHKSYYPSPLAPLQVSPQFSPGPTLFERLDYRAVESLAATSKASLRVG